MIIIIISKTVVPKGYRAITLYPFIFVCSEQIKNNKYVINHEKIHLRQELELLGIGFLLVYGISYLINLFKYKNHKKAYKNIIFERECYYNHYDLEYLKKRKWFAYWR